MALTPDTKHGGKRVMGSMPGTQTTKTEMPRRQDAKIPVPGKVDGHGVKAPRGW